MAKPGRSAFKQTGSAPSCSAIAIPLGRSRASPVRHELSTPFRALLHTRAWHGIGNAHQVRLKACILADKESGRRGHKP